MTKAKKAIAIIFIVAFCGLWACGITFSRLFVYESVKSTIRMLNHRAHPFLTYAENWEVNFPESANLLYRYSTVSMDGEHYSVINFDSYPDEFLADFNDTMTDKDRNRYQFAVGNLINNGIDESKIIAPDENSRIMIKEKNNDKMFLIYNQNVGDLHVLISYL